MVVPDEGLQVLGELCLVDVHVVMGYCQLWLNETHPQSLYLQVLSLYPLVHIKIEILTNYQHGAILAKGAGGEGELDELSMVLYSLLEGIGTIVIVIELKDSFLGAWSNPLMVRGDFNVIDSTLISKCLGVSDHLWVNSVDVGISILTSGH